MAGDPMTPPIADEFRFSSPEKKSVPFSAKIFDECRAQIEARHFPNVEVRVPELELQSMAAGAKRRGQQRIFSYKLNATVEKLAEEFPIDGKEMDRHEQRIFRLRELEYELVRAKRYVVRAARQLTDKKDEELGPLFRHLVEYGRAIGGIHLHDLPADMRHAKGRQEQRNMKSKRPKQGRAKNQRPSA